MTLDITSKITGSIGNIAVRPEANLTVTIEGELGGPMSVWFQDSTEQRGPINLELQTYWPIGNNPPIDGGHLDLDKINEVFFSLREAKNQIITYVSLLDTYETRYLAGIAWDGDDAESNTYVDLGWFKANNGYAERPFARMRLESSMQLRRPPQKAFA